MQDRNETLFYKVLLDNFTEMAPIVYTPTVGWACLNYHKLYRRPRGMFFSAMDKDEMVSMHTNLCCLCYAASIHSVSDVSVDSSQHRLYFCATWVAENSAVVSRYTACLLNHLS